jgi:hypothetical protein
MKVAVVTCSTQVNMNREGRGRGVVGCMRGEEKTIIYRELVFASREREKPCESGNG